MTRLAVIWLLLAGVACDAAAKRPSLRVLFIGNSYTYVNDLPATFAGLARAAGYDVETAMVAPGGATLDDHWQRGEARAALRRGKWTHVVLQDQSMLGLVGYVDGHMRVAGDERFHPAATRWVREIAAAGATPVLYLTWARRDAPEDQAMLTHAYARVARETGARLAPVGPAWARVGRAELYGDDGSHPSRLGTELAALTLAATILERSPEGLGDDRALAAAAWAEVEPLRRGVPDLPPPPPPSPAPLPEGVPLELGGSWRGELRLYPDGPAPMALAFAAGAARLELGGRSFAITELRFSERALAFRDPTGVVYRAVSPDRDQLCGTAETTLRSGDRPVSLRGSFCLRRADH